MRSISIPKALVIALALAAMMAVPAGSALAKKKKSKAQKCQIQIDRAVQKFTKKKLGKLFKCAKKNPDNAASCLTSVSVALTLSKPARKQCNADVITGEASADALGFTSCTTNASGCTAPTDPDSMESCLQCSHDFETNCLFGAVYNVTPTACLSQ